MTVCRTATATGVGTAMLQLRENRGWDIAAAADACGIDFTTWWRAETGRSKPKTETLQVVARIFNVTLDDLVHGAHVTPASTPPREQAGSPGTPPGSRRKSQENENPPTHATPSSRVEGSK